MPDGTISHEWVENEPVATDVRQRPDQRPGVVQRRALLRLTAPLLGCRFDDLARRDDERKKQVARNRSAALAGVVIYLGIGGACPGADASVVGTVGVLLAHLQGLARKAVLLFRSIDQPMLVAGIPILYEQPSTRERPYE